MTDTALVDPLQASDVAAYLKRHPDFLTDYPELAAQLQLPREQGQVASLATYQLQNLREKNAEESKSSAFTPRPLIESMVAVIKAAPRERVVL